MRDDPNALLHRHIWKTGYVIAVVVMYIVILVVKGVIL